MTTHPLSQKRSLSVGVAVFSLVLLGGCDQSPEMSDDEVSGEVQDAVEETREAADEAVEQTREAIEETGDRIEEATDKSPETTDRRRPAGPSIDLATVHPEPR